jgi:hypothetical protein
MYYQTRRRFYRWLVDRSILYILAPLIFKPPPHAHLHRLDYPLPPTSYISVAII